MNRFNHKPIFACDIDGTLGDWHAHFIEFARGWTGRELPDASEINPGLPLHKFLHMSKSTYRQCKLAFRQGGLKRSMPVYPGAVALTRKARKAGAEVWLCTTRPYLRLDSMDPDTRHWLRRNGFQFDGLLYGEHKYRDLVKYIDRQRVIAVLDDLPEMCSVSDSLGLPTFIRTQPYNKHIESYERVDDLWKFGEQVCELIHDYKLEEKK